MGDLDQGHSPFTNVFPVKVSGSVLGDHVVYIATAGDHAGSLLEIGDDA